MGSVRNTAFSATVLLFGVLATSTLLTGCGGPPAAMAPPPTLVTAEKIKTGETTQTVEYLATLKSRKSVTLSPQVNGTLTEILVSSGDQVKQGQLLMQIRPEESQAAVTQSQAGVSAAQADYQSALANLMAAQSQQLTAQSEVKISDAQYKRAVGLHHDQAMSDADFELAGDRLSKAKAALATTRQQINAQKAGVSHAQQSISQSKALLGQAQARLGYTRITAPFSGQLGDIPVKLGDYVSDKTILTSLTQAGPVEAYIQVPKELAGKFHRGMSVDLLETNTEQGAEPKVLATGEIFFISPRAEDTTQSILIKASIPNPEGRFHSEEQYRARLVMDRQQGLLVPTPAVVTLSGQDFVFLVQPAKDEKGHPKKGLMAHQVPISLGPLQGNELPVLKGLKEGDSVVTAGVQKLSEGAAITTKPMGSSPGSRK